MIKAQAPSLHSCSEKQDAICPRRSNPRKRQNSERLMPQQNKFSQPTPKKQNHSHPLHFSPAFWDNLSKIYLTKRALEELDRRNTQAAQPPYARLHRPITRRALAEVKKNSQPLIPAVNYLESCGTRDLINIRQSARHGGPDCSNLRGLPEPSNSLNQAMDFTQRTANTPKTKSTSPYNRNFEQKLFDGDVHLDEYEYPDGRVPPKPADWEEINRQLLRPRPSLSPSMFSDEDFQKFRRANAHARKEKGVSTSVIPVIEGDTGDPECVSGGIPFKNLEHLTDGTLVAGNPDIYYGSRPEQVDQRVREQLGSYIIPSTQSNLPIAPNFFLAVKGPDGKGSVAKLQACYDGALGARGMQSLQLYNQKDLAYDNNAYTFSSIYFSGVLILYTISSSQPTSSSSRPKYFMHQIRSFCMTDSAETFRQGATCYRNARDMAKKQRDEAIRGANMRAIGCQARMLAVNESSEQASSFASKAAFNETCTTIESPYQMARTSLTEALNATTHLQEPESIPGGLLALAKRSSEHSDGTSPQSERKRRNAGGSNYELSRRQPRLQSREPSGLSQQFKK